MPEMANQNWLCLVILSKQYFFPYIVHYNLYWKLIINIYNVYKACIYTDALAGVAYSWIKFIS